MLRPQAASARSGVPATRTALVTGADGAEGGAMVIPVLLTIVLAGAWPVDPPRVLAPYDPPPAAWAAGHRGVDLQAHTGTVVRALAAGTVTFAQPIAGKAVLVVAHPGGRRSTYEPVVATVPVGESRCR